MADIQRDDGAIIGYKPKLEYVKEINNETDQAEQLVSTSYDGITYTKTLSGFAENIPSTALSNLDFVMNNMVMLIDQLSKSFKNDNWNEYNNISSLLSAIESGNEHYIDNFINYHKNLITGSIIPELIGTINKTRKRLVLLSETLKKLYYGNDKITTEEAMAIDNSYLKQLQKYEVVGDRSKINYLSISQDSIVNRLVSLYSFDVNEKVISLSEIITKEDDNKVKQEQAELVKKLYREVNQEIESRNYFYNEEQSLDAMVKSLYNYYDKRKDANEIYIMKESSLTSTFIARKTKEYKDNIKEAVININKTLAGNAYYLSKITPLEQEKAFLMNIYAMFNYNSEK